MEIDCEKRPCAVWATLKERKCKTAPPTTNPVMWELVCGWVRGFHELKMKVRIKMFKALYLKMKQERLAGNRTTLLYLCTNIDRKSNHKDLVGNL